MITLVPFFKKIDFNSAESKKLKRRAEFDYYDCLKKMHETFKHHHSDNDNFIVQTDLHTEINGLAVYRSNLKDMNLIESIIVSNKNFVTENKGKIVLAGSDHIICGNLSKVFDHEFDIATFVIQDNIDVNHRLNIINFLFCNVTKKNHQKIIQFLTKRYEIFQTFQSQDKIWWGDQKSLSVMLEQNNILSRYMAGDKPDYYDYNGLKIKLFKYNEEYIISPNNKPITISENVVLMDFAGGLDVKKYIHETYEKSLLKEPFNEKKS